MAAATAVTRALPGRLLLLTLAGAGAEPAGLGCNWGRPASPGQGGEGGPLAPGSPRAHRWGRRPRPLPVGAPAGARPPPPRSLPARGCADPLDPGPGQVGPPEAAGLGPPPPRSPARPPPACPPLLRGLQQVNLFLEKQLSEFV